MKRKASGLDAGSYYKGERGGNCERQGYMEARTRNGVIQKQWSRQVGREKKLWAGDALPIRSISISPFHTCLGFCKYLESPSIRKSSQQQNWMPPKPLKVEKMTPLLLNTIRLTSASLAGGDWPRSLANRRTPQTGGGGECQSKEFLNSCSESSGESDLTCNQGSREPH